jgi:hexokinase
MSDLSTQRFLENHGFSATQPSCDDLLHAFDAQMTAGLAGQEGSLAMIPAYVAAEKPVPLNAPVLVMDAGGTNLRVAVVWFDAKGKARIEDFRKYPMPGTEGQELDAATFFGTLAGHLAPIAERSSSLGLCFSYPTEITPNCDGRLLRWTKQIKAQEVVGRMIGESLLDALRAKTGRSLQVRVLNDTVATLLAGKSVGVSRRYSSYVGFILGTGTNTAYVERHERIAKLPTLPAAGHMAINVESGNFDGVPQSDFDRALDASLPDRGAYRFEKMISGAYLGSLALHVFRQAAAEGLFSPAAATAILALKELKNKDFDDFVDNPFLTGTAFDAVPLRDDDRRTLMALGTPVFLRAARLTAVNIAAGILRSGAGRDPLHPVCVTIDGSTYYRTRSAQLKSRIEQHLRDILHPRGLHYDLIAVDDAPIIGAAVAGLTA